MQTINLGGRLSMATVIPLKIKNFNHHPFSLLPKISNQQSPSSLSSSPALRSVPFTAIYMTMAEKRAVGLGRASQVAELFPTISPEIIVREARIEDCWQVAETHCSSFFPEHSFPLDFVWRIDRLVGMLFGFSIPNGCKRTCLVAVTGSSGENSFLLGSDDFKIGVFDGIFRLNRGNITGILTVDTVADFLPRKGPLRQRRTGIAYISNVAVQERYRRKGIAKKLIAKAEAKARSWGCRAIALHCELNNTGAINLYKNEGFKCIKVPEGAKWPHPKLSPDMKFNFMMKLLQLPNN
ncbi:hypothetical protein ACJIZ3_000018 [Penstemon smallii]|uniref:N-acetyltransferase domain-containing protein n=1 Tax=Penstemon smallii TaxID=265156 RepID=A0ABD3RCH6_9LAMI